MGSSSERIPIDPKLYEAASKGDINLLGVFLTQPVNNRSQPDEIVIPVVEGGAHLQHSRSEGGPPLQLSNSEGGDLLQRSRSEDGAAFQHSNCLLGVTHIGNSALHIAARFGHLEVARKICCEKVSLLTRQNDKLETPLHYAAKTGNHELVRHFIQISAEANNIDQGELLRTRNKEGETALYQSVLFNHAAVVEEFMRADNNQSISPLASIPDNKNISPLFLAVMQEKTAIVSSLIQSLPNNVSRGAYAGPGERTALHAAARTTDDEGFVQEILNWKPELAKSTDESGSTPLHYAASCGNLKVVRVILQKNKTCAYMADSSGLFPVHIAVKMNFVEVVAEFFEQCPDSDELLDKKGRNFVHIAVVEGSESIVRWICRRSEVFAEAMNAQDDNGDTAMHLAIKAKGINIFARLLETKRPHLSVMNKQGFTPHALAISEKPIGFPSKLNPDSMMVKILHRIRCCKGLNRPDHVMLEAREQWNQNKEKLVESYENMAKSMAIGTVLIASAAFAGAFTVISAYKSDIRDRHKSTGLSMAFKSFIFVIAYAFICSITATHLLVDAALSFLDPTSRKEYILISKRLVGKATRGFVAAFAIGVYVVLTPVCKWLAILVCLASAVVLVLFKPHTLSNILVTRTPIRYFGWRWKETFFGLQYVRNNLLFATFVVLVLIGSLVPSHGVIPAFVWADAILITYLLVRPYLPWSFLLKLKYLIMSFIRCLCCGSDLIKKKANSLETI